MERFKGTKGRNDWNGDFAVNAGYTGGDVRNGFRGCNTCDIVSLILEYGLAMSSCLVNTTQLTNKRW